jgi:hypothetical protein
MRFFMQKTRTASYSLSFYYTVSAQVIARNLDLANADPEVCLDTVTMNLRSVFTIL